MTQAEEKQVAVERRLDGHLLRLTLDAGKGNILTAAVLEELRAALQKFGPAPELRAILIDHAGEHFSFGASVEEHMPDQMRSMLTAMHGLARDLAQLNVASFAALSGLCLGGGLELAMMTDRIFAAPGTRCGQPEIALAVFAPLASLQLPRRVGSARAAELLLSGRRLEFDEALAIGLLDVAAEDPSAAVEAWVAEYLSDKSAAALRFATRAARLHWLPGFLGDLEAIEALYLEGLMQTRDAVEGLTAFLEKRKPDWQDR